MKKIIYIKPIKILNLELIILHYHNLIEGKEEMVFTLPGTKIRSKEQGKISHKKWW